MAMKKLLAIFLVSCFPSAIAGGDSSDQVSADIFGSVDVLVLEDTPPATSDVLCSRGVEARTADCVTVNRAVLSARVKRVPALQERGRWT
jgi:hypothetical protein